MTKNKVWVLGSSNIDFTYNVEKLPFKGQTISASACETGTGGKGANQAIAASHFGSHVSFIGAVGSDPEGEVLLAALKKWKIDTGNVEVLQGMRSGNAVIFVDANGDNFISVFPGANQHVPLSLIDNINFSKGDFLISQLEVNMDIIESSFVSARLNNVTTVLNPAPYNSLSKTLLNNIDIIILNETEASQMTGIDVIDEHTAKKSADKLLKMGIASIIITLGGHGVILTSSGTTHYFPGHKVVVKDTQGAGDVFIGTFISKLTEGKNIEESVSIANYVASLSVTRSGSTQICLPDLNEIELKYDKQFIPL